MVHNEFVCKFKDGKYEWIDPVDDVSVLESPHMETIIMVLASTGHSYSYYEDDIDQWVVREYDGDNYYPFGDFVIERKGHLEAIEKEKRNENRKLFN